MFVYARVIVAWANGRCKRTATLSALCLLLSGCALSPFSENSVWRRAQGIMEGALREGKGVLIVGEGPPTVWHKVGDASVALEIGSDHKGLGSSYRVIPVQPGTYALAGGYTVLPDTRLNLDAVAKEDIATPLGRVELRNRDLLEYYDVPIYIPPRRVQVTDNRSRTRWDYVPGYWTTRTLSRVVGHYVACDVTTPAADVSGKPFWVGFSVAPGEIVLLQRVGFADVRPDTARCNSAAVLGGAWGCPIQGITIVLEDTPALGSALGAASTEGLPAALISRFVVRDVTRGALFDGPYRQVPPPEPFAGGTAYAFEVGEGESGVGAAKR